MPNSKQIVYLSQAQYAELIANGSITVDGVTVTYDENDIYVTPQAEPVTDVRVAGTSVAANGVAEIPKATTSVFGAASILSEGGLVLNSEGRFYISPSNETQIKTGTGTYKPLTAPRQHMATFYGLAKAAGDSTQSQSSNSVGEYTPEAKAAIQQMLGVSDLIATAENNLVASKAYKVGDVFTANGKLYKVTAAIAANESIVTQDEGETISGANAVETKVGEGFVKFTDYARENEPGIVGINSDYGIAINNQQPGHYLYLNPATPQQIKTGTQPYRAITPDRQEKATFYGLAKAAGDITQSASDNAVGQYTDNAKAAIRAMIGAENGDDIVKVQDEEPTTAATKIWLPETAPESVTVPTVAEMEQALSGKVDDVQINGTSIVSEGVANIPFANANTDGGIFRFRANRGLIMSTDGYMATNVTDVQINSTSIIDSSGIADIPYATSAVPGLVAVGNGMELYQNAIRPRYASEAELKAGTEQWRSINPMRANAAAFYGLAKASGDTTQSASSNAVGVYTDNAKASIKAMLGIQDGSTGTVDISSTTPTITAVENTRYVCGEVTSLNFTPAASGICIVRFTSGSTVTVLTLPSTVKFPEWFDPTSLETNTIYEICVTDGIYGAVMSWAQ